VAIEVYYFLILFIFQEPIRESEFVYLCLLKNFHCIECHFIFTFTIIWICINLSLFELYSKFMTLMYFILFYLNL